MIRSVFLSLIFICLGVARAQEFRATATLPTVEADGFYRIFISPELSTHLNESFNDIRIYDKNQREVPYLLQKDVRTSSTKFFHEYAIRSKTQENGYTSLVLHNPDRTPITNISLLIKNAEVIKEATLLGSDDEQRWYALKQRFLLHAINNPNGTVEIKIVDFPLSNYSYYLLRVEDSLSAPLNILKAGFYEQYTESGSYTEVPSLQLQAADSLHIKKTYVSLMFDTLRIVDKVDLTIEGVPFYHRNAVLYDIREREDRKGQMEEYHHKLLDFEVRSTQAATLWLPGIKAQELLIVVDNQDNPPLTFAEGKAFQLNRYLVAWLSKENTYVLKLGNDRLASPVYDIAYFKDSIPEHTDILRISDIMLSGQPIEPGTVTGTIFTRKQIIWVAIVTVIAVLAFMSIKVIRETGKGTGNM